MMAYLKRNLGWKIFSLLMATFLWVIFARDPELGAFVSVPVEYKGMPEVLEISSDAVASVSLSIRGSAERLREFAAAPTAVILDFTSIHKPGEITFDIDEENVKLPVGLRLIRAIPAQLRFQFEPRTVREVPVEVRFGAPQRGYEIARYQARPETVRIVGPESRVHSIESAITDPVDIGTVVSEAEFRVNAFVGDPHVRFQKPAKISVKVFMEKK